MTERSLKAINEGKIVGTIMVDFRKAFDLVDHDLLLRKLSLYKCGSYFLKLMTSYLKDFGNTSVKFTKVSFNSSKMV